MIKFFRKIRQRLLSENKFSKYLLYAIGEIILVVIGILIALQINSWNNEKLEKKQACTYLLNLLIDLEEQGKIIDAQFSFEQEAVLNGEGLLNSYSENDRFLIDDDFSQRISILNNRMTFKVANSTFEELLASGNTSLIDNENLKSKILDYFKDLELFRLVITQNNEYIDNHFAPLALQISTHYMPNLQIKSFQKIIEKGYLEKGEDKPIMNKDKAFKIIRGKLTSNEYELRLLNELNYRYRIAAVHLSLMDEIKSKTATLIDIIRDEQSACP